MESSRTSLFLKRALAAAAAYGNGNPLAFTFPAVHNLIYALRTVSRAVVDTDARQASAALYIALGAQRQLLGCKY